MLERICGMDNDFNNWIKNLDKKRNKIDGYSFISTFEKIRLCRYLANEFGLDVILKRASDLMSK